ncbi:MAG: transglycosylase domain-containing protein [Anaerolineae bacterium]
MLREGRVVSGGGTIAAAGAGEHLLSDGKPCRRRSVLRKLRESFLALRITAAYDKDAILELYLNEVYFGQLAYGAEGRGARISTSRDLDVARGRHRRGSSSRPTRTTLVAWDAAKAARSIVLDRMVAAGYATAAEADLARAGMRCAWRPAAGRSRPPHFTSRSAARATNERATRPTPSCAGAGLHVVTSLDLDVQRAAGGRGALIRWRI